MSSDKQGTVHRYDCETEKVGSGVVYYEQGVMEPWPEGEWVEYADHVESMERAEKAEAALVKEREQLEARLDKERERRDAAQSACRVHTDRALAQEAMRRSAEALLAEERERLEATVWNFEERGETHAKRYEDQPGKFNQGFQDGLAAAYKYAGRTLRAALSSEGGSDA